MNKILFIALLSAPFFLSCSNCVTGDGNVISENRTASGIHSITLNGPFEVELTRDTLDGIKIEAETNIIPEITTPVVNGRLNIGTRKCVSPKKPIKIYCSIKELRSLELNGSGSIQTTNVFPSNSGILEVLLDGAGTISLGSNAQKLTTSLNGSGNITLKGGTGENHISINGAGDVHAFELSTNTSEISIAGSGNAEVSVNKDLETNISGSGDITYKGNPETINQSNNGSGKVRKK